MNELAQTETGLLGSPEAVLQLAASKNSRLLLISDTHGHYEVFESILSEFGSECNALVFSGDGMWDIIQYLEKSQDNSTLMNALPSVIAFVAGNGDGDQYRINLISESLPSFYPEVSDRFLEVPSRQVLHASGHSLFIVHGHRHSVDVSIEVLTSAAENLNCDIAVFGHTHIPFSEEFSNVYLINPGSPTRPRGNSEPSFALLNLDSAINPSSVEFYKVKKGMRGDFKFEPMLT